MIQTKRAEPSLMIVGGPTKRKVGRPLGSVRVVEPRAALSSWVPASLHDRACAAASAREISLSELVKQALVVHLDADKK